MENNRITIHGIAKALGIDSSTVSRALSDSSRVTTETKERVLAKAKELGYQRNLVASNLRRRKTNTIGVVVPRISRPFIASTLTGIEEVAYSLGYSVIICQSMEELKREQSIIRNLIASRVDGVLISISMETVESSHLEYFQLNGIPLVFFDRHCKEMPDSSQVVIDDYQAAYNAVEHLIKKGCRRIVHFSGPQGLEIYINRFEGYKMALKASGIPYDQNLVFSSRLMESDGIEFAKKILQMPDLVDGVFSANDTAAIATIRYLKSQGVKIPGDIAVVGFSNDPMSEVIEPSLTTIDQSGIEMGKIACNLLIERINAEEVTNDRRIIMRPVLIERESTNR